HGHSDSLLIKAGSGALTLGVPSSPGVPAVLADHTITLDYNDAQQVKDCFASLGEQIACIIVEPVAGNMNCVPPLPGFLETLRAVCDEYGSLLILDEVMRSEEHTSELQSRENLVCRLLLEKKKNNTN